MAIDALLTMHSYSWFFEQKELILKQKRAALLGA